MLRKSFALLLILGIVLLNNIRIECDPESVTLSPGERTIVKIRITNLNNKTEYINLEYMSTEAIGSTRGVLSEDYFSLLPNETNEVELLLIASTGWFHSESANDGELEFIWSTGDFMNQTYRDSVSLIFARSNTLRIDVSKDMTIPFIIFCILSIISIIFIAIIIIRIRKKKTEDLSESHSENDR
jgi:hypothetical protein